jgi:hypothetical protein
LFHSYAVTGAASLSLHAAGIPSFKLLDKEPLGHGSILVGGTISMIALAAFAFVLSRPSAYQSFSGSDGRMSPIEAVLQHLNRAPAPDSEVSSLQDATTSASAQGSEPQAQPSAGAIPERPPVIPPNHAVLQSLQHVFRQLCGACGAGVEGLTLGGARNESKQSVDKGSRRSESNGLESHSDPQHWSFGIVGKTLIYYGDAVERVPFQSGRFKRKTHD